MYLNLKRSTFLGAGVKGLTLTWDVFKFEMYTGVYAIIPEININMRCI